MKSPRALIQVFCAITLGLITPPQLVARAQDNKAPEPSQARGQFRKDVDSWLKREVKHSAGHWDTDRYSFYMGFATAGINDDAAPAIAMRRVAFTLMNNTLSPGDKLTPVAFEMQVYKIGSTISLTTDEATRAQFANTIPRTPMPQSKGGHDIEQSLYDILCKIPPAARVSTIILLWNKDNASQDPNGLRTGLFSEDNKHLQTKIREGHFRPILVRHDFEVKSDSKSLSVAVTALFPAKLVSLPYGRRSSRYPTFSPGTWQPPGDAPSPGEALPNPAKPDPATPHPPPLKTVVDKSQPHVEGANRSWWKALPILIIVTALIIAVVITKRSRLKRQRQSVAASVTPAAKLETIPGSLRVTIGPDEQTVAPLAKNSNWTITKDGDGKFILTAISNNTNAISAPATAPKVAATQAPPAVAPAFVKLSIANTTALLAEADSGAQFTELQGTAANQSDSRTLKIEPGKRVLCRIQPADASSKIRFEIVYNTRDQKAGGA